MHLPNLNIFVITTLFLIINLLVIGIYRWNRFNQSNFQHEVVKITVPVVSLPYITDNGTQLSANGIPRGTFSFYENDYIDNIELTAILLEQKPNQKKNLIKTRFLSLK